MCAAGNRNQSLPSRPGTFANEKKKSPTCMHARFFWSSKKMEQSHTSRCAWKLHLPGLLLYHNATNYETRVGDYMEEKRRKIVTERECLSFLRHVTRRSTDLQCWPNCHFPLRRGNSNDFWSDRDRSLRFPNAETWKNECKPSARSAPNDQPEWLCVK